MCIFALALDAQPDYPFILLFNRDEFFERPTTALEWQSDGLVCAIDSQAGGTWMAVDSKSGRIAALTNVRCRMPEGVKLQSRGQLVRRVLHGDDNALRHIELTYAAFNLLHGKLGSRDSPSELAISACTPADHGDGPWQTTTRPIKRSMGSTVITKTNDSTGRVTDEATTSHDGTWPKAVWLRREVSRVLRETCGCEGGSGVAALLKALEPLMTTTALPGDAAQLAESYRGAHSHVTPSLERLLQRAPFLEPFDFEEGEGERVRWYGTVSQSAVFQCRSEGCVWCRAQWHADGHAA